MTLVASNGHQLHSPLGTPCDDGDDDGGDDGGGDVVRFPYPLASGGKLVNWENLTIDDEDDEDDEDDDNGCQLLSQLVTPCPDKFTISLTICFCLFLILNNGQSYWAKSAAAQSACNIRRIIK